MPLSSSSSQPFIEQETLVLIVERKPTITQLDGNGRRVRKVRPMRSLPHTGAGVVRVQPIGGRLTLRPSDELAARALGATRAALGFHWDAKKGQGLPPADRIRGYVYSLDNFLRRGVTEWDSLRLLAIMTGLPLEMAPGVETGIARYRARLERQLRPIPRVTWFDEDANKDEAELEAEVALGDENAALQRWGQGVPWYLAKKK
jgi:hypothetical protein